MKYSLSNATKEQVNEIIDIIEAAKNRRKNEGSDQWQDGYPNIDTIMSDIESGSGYVFGTPDKIVAYVCIKKNDEPAYDKIEGKWLTNNSFVVIHRLAIADGMANKGIATKIFKLVEQYAFNTNIFSIKVDTNFDNLAMLQIFKKLGYFYCGKVSFRNSERLAYEKVLHVSDF